MNRRFSAVVLTACLFSPAIALAQGVTGCTPDDRVLTADQQQGVIVGGPVAGMCLVRTPDGNIAPMNMDGLTSDTAPPPPTDIRSVVPGAYGCMAQGDATGAIVLTIDILSGDSYAIAGEGEGEWKPYDDLSLQFVSGPLAGRFGTGQNAMIMFSRSSDTPQLFCKVRS